MMVSWKAARFFWTMIWWISARACSMRCKYRPGQRKYLLKKALAGWLPKTSWSSPKGFGIPLNLWLRSLPPADAAIPGLKPWVIRKCSEIHAKRHGDFRYFLWDAQVLSRMAGGI